MKNREELETIRFDLSVLMEAAERIKNPKYSKTHGSFSVFGSIFKKFMAGKGVKCEKMRNSGSFLRNEDFEMGSGCSCSRRRRKNSPGESLEIESDGFSLSEKYSCSSPVSTFHSSLQNSPSTYIRSPGSPSPATSPIVADAQGNGKDEKCVLKKHLEEEDDEYFSPVSILDPPFEDDTTQHEDEEDEDDYECSYAVVQRAKEKLLERLLRFEKLAELDPVELERSVLETKSDSDDNDDDENEKDLEKYNNENIEKSFKFDMNKNKLVSDLIAKRKGDGVDERKIVERQVCKKVNSWEKMEFITKIEMIVEFELRREVDNRWKTKNQEGLEEIAHEVEVSIFGYLVEELIDEFL